MFFVETEHGGYRYYQKYWDDNNHQWRQVSCTLKSNSRQAQSEARKRLEAKIEKKLLVVKDKVKVSSMYAEWLVLRKLELKESTFVTQKQNFAVFLREFGDQYVDDLVSKDLQRFLMTKGWSVSYQKMIKALIKMFLNYCLKMKIISENPAEDVLLPRRTKTIEDIRKDESKFYDRKQMRHFLKFLRAEGYSERMNLRAEFMYLTGERFGEAGAFSEADCFFGKQNYIVVEATLSNRNEEKVYKRTAPKTLKAYRKIFVNTRVVEIVNRMKELNKEFKNPDKIIFLNERGKPMSNFTFNAYLKKYSEKWGQRKDITLTSHVLRHSHVCLLAEIGIPQKVIMERMGHRDEKVTLMIYTHVTKRMEIDLSEKLESVLSPSVY